MYANVPKQLPIHGGNLTVSPVAALSAAAITPEFVRFPRAGQVENLTGLRRAQLYNLASEGIIKTVSLRRRGKMRGTRLIVAESLLGYLRGLAAEQNPQPPTATPTADARAGGPATPEKCASANRA